MRKRGLKNLFTGSMGLVLVLSLCVVPVSAMEGGCETVAEISVGNVESGIVPMGAICAQCGKGTLITSTAWGAWYNDDQVSCTHGHAWGVDLIQKRQGTKTTKCNVCGKGWTSTVTESRTVCCGFE